MIHTFYTYITAPSVLLKHHDTKTHFPFILTAFALSILTVISGMLPGGIIEALVVTIISVMFGGIWLLIAAALWDFSAQSLGLPGKSIALFLWMLPTWLPLCLTLPSHLPLSTNVITVDVLFSLSNVMAIVLITTLQVITIKHLYRTSGLMAIAIYIIPIIATFLFIISGIFLVILLGIVLS